MVDQRRCSPGAFSGQRAGPGRVTRATIVNQPPGGGTAASSLASPRLSWGRRLSPRGLPSHRRGGREGAAQDRRPGRSPASRGRCSAACRAKVPPGGCRARGTVWAAHRRSATSGRLARSSSSSSSSAIPPGEESPAGLKAGGLRGAEQDPLLQKLHALWAWRDMEKLREEMRLGFASLNDPLVWLLDVLDCCVDWRGPVLLTHIVRELQGWIKCHASDQPSGLKLEKLQARLFPLLARCNVSLLQPLVIIYQLHTADRHHLLGFISQLCQQGKFKEAATLSIKLKLQPDLEFEKMCIPLLLQDKTELVEAYVEGSPELQQSLLRLLDSWSVPGFQVKDLARQYRALPGKWPEKINCRTMHKMAFRLLDRYSLDPVLCPHILNQRHLGTLKYLLHKRFVEKSMTQENWADHIQGIVQDNRWLQEQLVQLLVRYAGLGVAAQWAQHYSLLGDSLPPGLAARMEETAIPERDDASEQTPSAWDSMKEECYQLPVPRAGILFLSTWEEVMACQEQVLQPGQVVGIDMEWRPSFSTIGGKPRVSVVQLAIWGHVFLLDMLQLLRQGEEEARSAVCGFFQTLLADPAIVKLGYGMSGDLRNLMATCEISRDADLQLCGILDLQLVHQKLPKRSKKSCQPALDPWLAKDKAWGSRLPEKGLSLLVQEVLGRPLNKTEQLSNWEKRPLRETQILYAACDAYCLLEVHAKLLKDPAAFGLSSDMVGMMSKASRPKAKTRKPPRREQEAPPTVKESPASVLAEAPRASVGILAQDFRVVCDNMLQGLGRSLRCLGVDVRILGNDDEHRRAAEIAREENRVILTSGLPFHSLRSQVGEGRCFSVSCSEKARDQALQVLKHFNVRVALADVFSRCQSPIWEIPAPPPPWSPRAAASAFINLPAAHPGKAQKWQSLGTNPPCCPLASG
ncbi:exonuclease mut-7 homolog isoform X3 [Ahaetulla prasina]|uniref:exonuclease mut-7 homolog isoform X3 n=1 Tax=Ahaetulla prasina TaxID=499056 RepID=UPI0026494270|nr:exonuclease mut-7 homolog isoform X3 [Ahaetulla prasina]